MEISRRKFIIVFLVSAFAFQFISNSLLGPEVRLFPQNGEFFPGADSLIAWKSTLATILYPVKLVLLGPFPSVFKDPDPAPPVLLIAFGFYWTVIAFVLHFLLSKLISPKRA